MRKTADLVNEMLDVAKGAWLAAIAVGFPDETQFVFSTDMHPLTALNHLVQKGGSPIGILRFDRDDGSVQGSYRPFEEYAEQDWVEGYLAGLLNNTKEIIAMSEHRLVIPAAS